MTSWRCVPAGPPEGADRPGRTGTDRRQDGRYSPAAAATARRVSTVARCRRESAWAVRALLGVGPFAPCSPAPPTAPPAGPTSTRAPRPRPPPPRGAPAAAGPPPPRRPPRGGGPIFGQPPGALGDPPVPAPARRGHRHDRPRLGHPVELLVVHAPGPAQLRHPDLD